MNEPRAESRLSDIAAIVVNYGTAALSVQAVESLLGQSHGGRLVTVHLVDNSSPGDDALQLKKAHAERGWRERVILWLEAENHGFGRGNNVVLRALAAANVPPDAVFLLNPDARLENETIDILSSLLETAPDAAAAGASVLRPDHTPVTAAFRFPGLANEIARTANLSVLHQLWANRRVPLSPDHPGGPVDWVSGAAVMFRWEALRQVGFFDPGFFLYYEEVDLMRRLKAAGWSILYEPKAKVIHEEGAATGQFAGQMKRQRDPVYLYESWAHYFARACGRTEALGIALMMWPAALLNILHRRMRCKQPTLPMYFFSDHWRYVIWPLLSGKERG